MKLSSYFVLAMAPLMAVAHDKFKCRVKNFVVDANNVNAVSGTYHIKCNDIFGRLAYKLQIYKDGKPIGDPLTEDITAKNNAATNWYGAYLFPPGKLPSKDGVRVCMEHHFFNGSGDAQPTGRSCGDR